MLAHIHKHKQEGRGPDEAASHSYVDDVALRLYRTYEERLRAANAVDFEDLILLVARLLAETPEGDQIRRRFDYVLVDEFQDTNATQYRFLRELVSRRTRTSASSATTTRASTAGAAPTSATSATFAATTRTPPS